MELPTKGKGRAFTDQQVRRVRLIGSIQVRKGIDTFIRAAVQVLQQDENFLFEIWGADRNALLFGKTYSEIAARLIPEELQDKIVFAGGVPYSEIPALFNDSCFCVYPSRWENWANVCLEAMSYGCVVLASKNGGMSEMIEHGQSGFVIDPLDPSDIAEIILGHYKESNLLEAISHRAVLRSGEICDPQRAAEAIENNYRLDLLKRAPQKLGNDTPLVSVVIPYYNQPQYLAETVASVVASDYPNIEIVVVNDGSSTMEAEEVFGALSGVVKISKENGGLSSARNAGIQAAKGDFVLPLDADDLIERDYLRKGVEALSNNPELGYVSCHAQNFGEMNNAYIPIGYVPELMPYINTHGKCSNLYRKSLFIEYGGYDEVMTSYEDWDYLLTLHDHGVEGDVLPDEMFRYRRHYDSMVYVTANRQRTDLIQYMMIKHEKALAPHAAKMAIMLARLWKETEMKAELLELQLQNAYFRPSRLSAAQSGSGSRLQVYSEGGDEKSVFVDYPQQQWLDLRLNLPFAGSQAGYRLDPANCPGTIIIQDIIVREKRFGRPLFKASAGDGFSRCTMAGKVEHFRQNGFLVLRAHDDDPQIFLPNLPNAAGLLLDTRLYYTPESDCDIAAVLRLFFRNRVKGGLRKLASRLFGTF
nr:glycosyltransferase [Desulfogranum marinum]